MKIKIFTHRFINNWMRISTYVFLIFSGGNFIGNNLNSNNIINLLTVLFGCFLWALYSFFFKKRRK